MRFDVFMIESDGEYCRVSLMFIGNGSREKFEHDTREIIVNILNDKYSLVKIDEKTYIMKRSIGNGQVNEFLNVLRGELKYNGKVIVDYLPGVVLFYIRDLEKVLDIISYIKKKHPKLNVDFSILLSSVKPSEVIMSDEFINQMKERGWEPVELNTIGEVEFDEDGGFTQIDNEWYNCVPMIGCEKIIGGEDGGQGNY